MRRRVLIRACSTRARASWITSREHRTSCASTAAARELHSLPSGCSTVRRAAWPATKDRRARRVRPRVPLLQVQTAETRGLGLLAMPRQPRWRRSRGFCWARSPGQTMCTPWGACQPQGASATQAFPCIPMHNGIQDTRTRRVLHVNARGYACECTGRTPML